MKLDKRECGRRGGRATFARHGRAHMQTIGRRGAATFWRRYHLAPVGIAAFAIVRRDTGAPVALTNWYGNTIRLGETRGGGGRNHHEPTP
jgi:general stress protein YciG